MNAAESVIAMIDALEAIGAPYMVVGSLASNSFGVPRSTQDADFVIDPAQSPAGEIMRHIPPEIEMDPQMSFETITGTSRFVLRLKGTPFKIELFHLSNDPHDQARFKRRTTTIIEGRCVQVMAPDDVVITKLRWSKHGKRTKDIEDARNVIFVQGASLDWDYITEWCRVHDTLSLLNEVRNSIPESP